MSHGVVPSIQQWAQEIQTTAGNFPPSPRAKTKGDWAEDDWAEYCAAIAAQIEAARKIITLAAQIQAQAANLLKFPERYLTPQ
jgi:hypothetical protein